VLAAARRLGGGLALSLLVGGCVSTGGSVACGGPGSFPPGFQALYRVCVERDGARTFLLHLHVEPTGAYRVTGLGRLGQTLFEATGGGRDGGRVKVETSGRRSRFPSRSLVEDFRLAFVVCGAWPETLKQTGAAPVTRRFGSRTVSVGAARREDDGGGLIPVVFTVGNGARGYRVVAELADPVAPEGE